MWQDILKAVKILTYEFVGKAGNRISVTVPHKGFLPKDHEKLADDYWVQNHNDIKSAIGSKINYGPLALILTGINIVDTSEKGFSWGYDKDFKEIKEPDEVKLDSWLTVDYYYDIVVDLEEKDLMDRIEEDSTTSKHWKFKG